MDCSLLGSSVHGISQSRIPDWVALSSSRESSSPKGQTHISCIGKQILYHWAMGKAQVFSYTVCLFEGDKSGWVTEKAVMLWCCDAAVSWALKLGTLAPGSSQGHLVWPNDQNWHVVISLREVEALPSGSSETMLFPEILGDQVSSLCAVAFLVLWAKDVERGGKGGEKEDEEHLKGDTLSVVRICKNTLQKSSRNQEAVAQILPVLT